MNFWDYYIRITKLILCEYFLNVHEDGVFKEIIMLSFEVTIITEIFRRIIGQLYSFRLKKRLTISLYLVIHLQNLKFLHT